LYDFFFIQSCEKLFLLSTLKTVVLLNIFVEAVKFFPRFY